MRTNDKYPSLMIPFSASTKMMMLSFIMVVTTLALLTDDVEGANRNRRKKGSNLYIPSNAGGGVSNTAWVKNRRNKD